MGKSGVISDKLSWILVTSILVLFVAFLIMSCGTGIGPQQKVQAMGGRSLNTNGMPDVGGAYVGTDMFDIDNTELTVEAWIKNLSANISETILERINSGGVALFTTNNYPAFKIALGGVGATSTFSVTATTEVNQAKGWTHVAAVIVNADHGDADGDPDDHPGITCADGDGNGTGGESETPHMDIYINGQLEACGTTWDATNPNLSGPQYASNDDPTGDGVKEIFIGYRGPAPGQTQFKGLIDDVRFWKTARTQSQIQNCFNTELDLTNGECGRSNNDLGGYWMFNEVDGQDTSDYSGNGLAGTLYSPHGTPDAEHGDDAPPNSRSTDVPF